MTIIKCDICGRETDVEELVIIHAANLATGENKRHDICTDCFGKLTEAAEERKERGLWHETND